MILKTTPAWFARWVEERSWDLRKSWPIEGGRVELTLAYSDSPKEPRTVTIDCYRLYSDPGDPGTLVATHLPRLPGLGFVKVEPNVQGEKLDLGIRFELERVSPERIEVLCLYNAYVLPIETYLDELLTGVEEAWPEASGAIGKWREGAVGVMQPPRGGATGTLRSGKEAMVTIPSRVPTAFVSYSWDSDQHRDWVRELATRLRGDGVDVKLDQWSVVLGDSLPKFMETAVRENDFVLTVCTPRYKAKSDGRTGGAGYEGDIITAEVFTTGNQRKFIPILREGEWKEAAPSWLLGKLYVDLRGAKFSEANYRQLLETLHGMTPQPPPLGAPPAFRKQGDIPASSMPPSTAGAPAGGSQIIQQATGNYIAQASDGGTAALNVTNVQLQLARTPTAQYRSKLRQNLINNFSDNELRDLCFDMDVDYESLPGEGKSAKARELIAFCERRGRLPELVTKCYELRPNVAWGVE